MIVRIVRMHFTASGVGRFLSIFRANEEAIRNFPGCRYLELLKDVDNDLNYTTLSHWKDDDSLEAYRKSDLFASVWPGVKPLFRERPQAFSLASVSDHNFAGD